jgi:hypothetical protein
MSEGGSTSPTSNVKVYGSAIGWPATSEKSSPKVTRTRA